MAVPSKSVAPFTNAHHVLTTIYVRDASRLSPRHILMGNIISTWKKLHDYSSSDTRESIRKFLNGVSDDEISSPGRPRNLLAPLLAIISILKIYRKILG